MRTHIAISSLMLGLLLAAPSAWGSGDSGGTKAAADICPLCPESATRDSCLEEFALCDGPAVPDEFCVDTAAISFGRICRSDSEVAAICNQCSEAEVRDSCFGAFAACDALPPPAEECTDAAELNFNETCS